MTELQIEIAKALGNCSFCPGTAQKRFARNMASLAESEPGRELTPKQAAYLYDMAHRYRRQLPRSLVEFAALLKAGLVIPPDPTKPKKVRPEDPQASLPFSTARAPT